MKDEMKEKYQATLIGCAIGDSLGMPVEGWYREQIKKYIGKINNLINPVIVKDNDGNVIKEDEFGKIGYWTGSFKKGEYTDDTILTLALAESLIQQKKLDLEDVAKKQLEAYILNKNQGFGKTTINALENIAKGISPTESGLLIGPGNAPPMKMAPLGIYMHATKKIEESLNFAEDVGKITHLDPRSVVAGVIQSYAIYNLLEGIEKNKFLDSCFEICKQKEKPLTSEHLWINAGDLTSKIKWIKDNYNASSEEAFQYFGKTPKEKLPKISSPVYKSYPFALWMFQKYWDNPLDGLIETVNFGGDCDTTGAIYGALAGSKNGLQIFPKEWLYILQNKEKILQMGEDF